MSSNQSQKLTTWILGAGFSQPLGGPLLPDFFSEGQWSMISQAFPNAFPPSTSIAPKVRELFRLHLRASVSNAVDTVFWADAEQFLERLGFAADNPEDTFAKTLKVSLGKIAFGAGATTLKELFQEATKIVSAECSVFTRQERIGGEVWSPFEKWAVLLGENDRIITFNYDTVLDILRQKQEFAKTPKFRMMLPGGSGDWHGHDVPVFKLHGSANWTFADDNDRKRVIYEGDWPPSNCYRVAIAIPGPGKKDWVESHQAYWKQAMNCLRNSQRICFIGYRIPSSDALARDQLLEAISDNNHKGLQIQTVLGPDTASPDSRRLSELLRHVTDPSRCSVTAVPLYSQDFLAVYALRGKRSRSGG